MLVSVDDYNNCRFLCESNNVEFPKLHDFDREERINAAKEFLEEVEDDSSWTVAEDFDEYEDIYEWLNPNGDDSDEWEIIAEIETDEL